MLQNRQISFTNVPRMWDAFFSENVLQDCAQEAPKGYLKPGFLAGRYLGAILGRFREHFFAPKVTEGLTKV